MSTCIEDFFETTSRSPLRNLEENSGNLEGRNVQFFSWGQYDHDRAMTHNPSWKNIAAHIAAYTAEVLALGAMTLYYGLLSGIGLIETQSP